MQRQADQEDQGLEAALTKQVKGAQKIGYWPGPKSVIPINICLLQVMSVQWTPLIVSPVIDPVIFRFKKKL